MTNEYTKKYSQELVQLSNSEVSLQYVFNFVQSSYQKIDAEISSGVDSLLIGHYISMILDCTSMLRRCYDERNYKSFSHFKELETFLNKSKESMDLQSYKLIRKKISFGLEKVPSY